MYRYNFSEEEQKVVDLASDLVRCDFSQAVDGLTVKDLENHLRKTIKDDILGGRTFYQAFRANREVVFEIMEEIVNVGIGECINDNPFIEKFVGCCCSF